MSSINKYMCKSVCLQSINYMCKSVCLQSTKYIVCLQSTKYIVCLQSTKYMCKSVCLYSIKYMCKSVCILSIKSLRYNKGAQLNLLLFPYLSKITDGNEKKKVSHKFHSVMEFVDRIFIRRCMGSFVAFALRSQNHAAQR